MWVWDEVLCQRLPSFSVHMPPEVKDTTIASSSGHLKDATPTQEVEKGETWRARVEN